MPYVRRMGYLLVLLVGSALAANHVWNPAPPAPFRGLASLKVPRTLGGYSAPRDEPVDPAVRTALASAALLGRIYHGRQGDVEFVLIGGTDRSALHDPRSCLVGGGWRLENDHSERLPGTNVAVRACQATGRPGQPGYDMLYLYVVDGRIITSPTQIRAGMLWSALLGRKNTPVYFLRWTQPRPASSGMDPVSDHAALTVFAARMWTTLRPQLGLAPSA